MKNLQLQRLLMMSEREKTALIVKFDPKQTVILGANDTGKSCLMKSIYWAFGANSAKVNPTWIDAKVDVLVEFTIEDRAFRILRSGTAFGLYDGDGNAIWTGTGVTKGIGREIARLLDFKLTLADRNGELLTPPPAFLFLPFYVDQDEGWVGNWRSFAGLQMFSGFRGDVANFHAGIRPNAYYEAKADQAAAERAKDQLNSERRALERAAKRLRANRKQLHHDFHPDQFIEQIDALVAECQALQATQTKTQHQLAELNSRRAVLVEQSRIAERALGDLDADYEFLRKTADDEIVCPTCGTMHANDFVNKFSLISDVDVCRDFVLETRKQVERVDVEINERRNAIGSFDAAILRINAILDEQRGEVKFSDLIEGESERKMDSVLIEEGAQIVAQIGSEDIKSDAAVATMKSLEDKKRTDAIKSFYLMQMNLFVRDLEVPNLPEKSYRRIDSQISDTGSDLPRGLLAYYFAFLHTMKRNSSSAFCPIVIDTPVQQDQDADNAARMVRFCLTKQPADAQVILGTVSLHGVEYGGHIIQTDTKQRLLKTDQYDEVRALLKPYYSQLLK